MNSVQNYKNPVCFRACHASSTVKQLSSGNSVNHFTMMFRDLDVLNFVQNRIRQNFPNGTHIADFACSQGQEAHSLAMLLSDVNQDKKYKISGFDVAPNAVKMAKRGLFIIEDLNCESLLFREPETVAYKPGFHLFQNGKFLLFNEGVVDTKYYEKENKKLGITEDIAIKTKKLFEEHFSVLKMSKPREKDFICLHFPHNDLPVGRHKIVQADKAKFQGVVDFQVQDIRNISQIFANNRPGVVMANNFLYHITGATRNNYTSAQIKPAKELFERIHDAMPPNGILSIGRLSFDHLQTNSKYGSQKIRQNGKIITIFPQTKVHEALLSSGFEPIFYAKGSFYDSYVPAVWQKV